MKNFNKIESDNQKISLGLIRRCFDVKDEAGIIENKLENKSELKLTINSIQILRLKLENNFLHFNRKFKN